LLSSRAYLPPHTGFDAWLFLHVPAFEPDVGWVSIQDPQALRRFDFTKIVLTFMPDQINFQGFFVIHSAVTGKFIYHESTKL
jgi:hypothetical protein